MKRVIRVCAAGIVTMAAIVGCQKSTGSTSRPSGGSSTRPYKVRQAAVAGMFYPARAEELGKAIDAFLAEANSPPIENVRALICPHAGYPFSGPTAAYAYKQLVGRDVETVVVLGPSHTTAFQGAFVSDADAYETPLGKATVAALAWELVKEQPFVSKGDFKVQRPNWWKQSPKELPPFGEELPDTWEHSVEVQIPFLQKVAPKAAVVPVVCGELDPQQAAKVLNKHIGRKTIVVASSDLSHYTPYEMAKALDKSCILSILRLAVQDLNGQDACGYLPIQTVVLLAKQNGWKAKLLDYRNSGDTAGDKKGVVGYAAIAFYEPSQAESHPATATAPATTTAAADGPEYNDQERKFMLDLARKTLKEAVAGAQISLPDMSQVPDKLAEKKGCFITLTEGGQLRGCIGHIFPQTPLFLAVIENTAHAGLRDTRFKPVQADELDKIEIEISVLTVPQKLSFSSPTDLLSKLRPHTDGVILRGGKAQATYLPQVWEQIPDKTKFMEELAKKAGLNGWAWMLDTIVIETYQAEAFKEAHR